MSKINTLISVVVDNSHKIDTDYIRTTLRSLTRSVDNTSRIKVTVLSGVSAGIDIPNGLNVEFIDSDLSINIIKSISTKTPYICLLEAGSVVSKGIFNQIVVQYRKGISRDIYVAKEKRDDYLLNNCIAEKYNILIGRDIDSQWIGSNGFVITRSLLDECTIDIDKYKYDRKYYIFSECVARAGAMRVIEGHSIQSHILLEDQYGNDPKLYDKKWYVELNEFWQDIILICTNLYDGFPRYLQHNYLYHLQWRFKYNFNNVNKCSLWEDEINDFFDGVSKILNNIEDEFIVSKESFNRVVSNNLKIYLLKLKKDDENFKYRYFRDDTVLLNGNQQLVSAMSTKLDIDLMDITGDIMEISGSYAFPLEYSNDFKIVATYQGEDIEAEHTGRYSWFNSMGVRIFNGYDYTFKIKLPDVKKSEIKIFLVSKRNKISLNFNFRRPMSKLKNKNSYWKVTNKIIHFKSHRIVIERYRKKNHLKKELNYLKYLILKKSAWSAAILRILYYISHTFYRNSTIWLFQDKVYKAGDNAEYLYRYSKSMNDGIKKYYLLSSSSNETKRFKSHKIPYLKHLSLKSKLLFLNSSKVFATHTSVPFWYGFVDGYEEYFRDLFNYDVMFIQHGLSVQGMSKFLNRTYDNTKHYFIASNVERKNLLLPEYGYKDSMLHSTGVARYDGLINNDKKQILITPTWRTYLAAPEEHGKKRARSDVFESSKYKSIYESLINDERLHQAAAKYGYKIIYLLHPNLGAQANDFSESTINSTEIIPASDGVSYEKLLTESSLMVTDYSGVQFDFAYMYKPVVYFHPPELPPSYEEGFYKYDKHALGDIYRSIDNLVESLCEYMANECILKPKYKTRIDTFFYNHDNNNSKRIYDYITTKKEI